MHSSEKNCFKFYETRKKIRIDNPVKGVTQSGSFSDTGEYQKLLANIPQSDIQYSYYHGIQPMNPIRKDLILLFIIGILVCAPAVIALCSSYCSSNAPDFDPPVDGSCPFSFHSFVQIVIGGSAFFVLPLVGLFHIGDRPFIPPGVYGSPFKPPRFSTR